MKSYIEISDLSGESIRRLVNDILEADSDYSLNPQFMLGKASSYVEVAVALQIIDLAEGAELLDWIFASALEFEFS